MYPISIHAHFLPHFKELHMIEISIVFHMQKNNTISQLMQLCTSLIPPCLRYFCHILGASSAAPMHDTDQRKSIFL